MRKIFRNLTTVLLVFGAALASGRAAASGNAAAENLAAIVRFIEAHQLDTNDRQLSDPDGVLGSREDQYTYRLLDGIPAAQHQHMKKYPSAKGWYYLGRFRGFSVYNSVEAAAYAAKVWATLQPVLEAQGFTLITDNPWDTRTMKKPAGTGVIQVWLSFMQETDGSQFVLTLRVSPNVG